MAAMAIIDGHEFFELDLYLTSSMAMLAKDDGHDVLLIIRRHIRIQ
jgi:hypothetical protein